MWIHKLHCWKRRKGLEVYWVTRNTHTYTQPHSKQVARTHVPRTHFIVSPCRCRRFVVVVVSIQFGDCRTHINYTVTFQLRKNEKEMSSQFIVGRYLYDTYTKRFQLIRVLNLFWDIFISIHVRHSLHQPMFIAYANESACECVCPHACDKNHFFLKNRNPKCISFDMPFI